MKKLKGKLRENDKTYAQAAKLLDISVTTFNKKINGDSEFNVWEAKQLKGWLNLSTEEFMEIFFANKVA